MKTNYKPSVEKSTIKNTLLIASILLVALNFPFSSGECFTNGASNDPEYRRQTGELIRTSLNECHNQVVWLDGIELQTAPLICAFYHKTNFTPVWTKGNKLNTNARALINIMKDSYKYGFEPANFDISSLEHFIHNLEKEAKAKKSAMIRVRFEFLMTNSVFAFMSYLIQGTEYSNSKDAFIDGNPVISHFADYLYSIISDENICTEILSLQPNNEEYASLQQEMDLIISNMETTENSISIPSIELNTERVYALFSYIFLNEGLSIQAVNPTDSELFSSLLIQFQDSKGIRKSGKMDNATCRAATNLVQAKYEELALRLENIRKKTKFDNTLISFNY